MDVPKEKKLYCKKCKKHTLQKMKEFKPAAGRPMAQGNRRHKRNTKGYMGKYKYVATVKKQNKTPTFVVTCTICNAKAPYSLEKRMKKGELK
jgi:large subunit ribosomal protein L44e